ncbi:cation diffusion facilitator family transporter [Sulfuriferula nivalis]|uniref:Cobalt transporter n=1 Tax=Sulfuriferula nivalis TaxID=2675298 RepID=A0A809RHI2_9PROT|nr:cation diffusion facilitator family transporter [Sulfuriferula nivalis]BBP00304.1 cobalt transporter [Sulfuriferula nivalis]
MSATHDDHHEHSHGCDHHHGHGHHHHDHSHVDTTSRAFAVGVGLNLAFVIIEIGFGLYADSLSLLADAGHNFSDVIGLLAAWGALILSKRVPSLHYTYGLRSTTILAALANAMLLLIAVGGISWEAIRRFTEPMPVNEPVMIWVALVGVVVNVGTALMLMRGHKEDLNLRGAFIHMIADAAVSVGVAIAGVLMLWTGWLWLDPAISLLIAAAIMYGTWGLFKQSLKLALHAVPDAINPAKVLAYLQSLPEVQEVHDLHIWGMSTTENALTAHLVTPAGHPGDSFLAKIAEELSHHHSIQHATFQIELGEHDVLCKLAPADVV